MLRFRHFFFVSETMRTFSSTTKATALGVLAPVLWGTTIPLVRGIVEDFGLTLGEFALYSLATVFLMLTVGLPDFKKLSARYLVTGLGSAVACSLCLAFSIYLSNGGKQTVEVGMINYLWPAMTIVFAVLFTGVKSDWRIIPGIILSLAGLFWILSGGEFSIDDFLARWMSNPWSYILAFFGALSWAIYSTVTKLWSNDQNISTLIFACLAVSYGTLWLCGVAPSEQITVRGIGSVIFGGFALSAAYVFWTHGVLHGKIAVLSIASYFTPVLSCIFSVLWIDAKLTPSFWTGVAVLTVGSLLCWQATRRG